MSILYRSGHAIEGYVVAIAGASTTTLIVLVVYHYVTTHVAVLYLPMILATAANYGLGSALLCSAVGVLEYDFFVAPPIFSFTFDQAQDILAFCAFVVVAAVTSHLATGSRARVEATRRRAAETGILYELSQALMSAHDVHDVLNAITERVAEVFDVDRCAIFISEESGRLQLAAETLRDPAPRDPSAHATLSWVYEKGTEVGVPVGDVGKDGHRRVYAPLRLADRVLGVMEVGVKRAGQPLDQDERRLVTSFAAQAAMVISRAQSDEERQRLEVLEESDQLKSALLSAVSHDLRTPLASIKASATTLLLADAAWSSEEGREMLRAIDHEADRLNRLVGNLLDLSRIEAGILRPVLEWYDVQEVIDTALPQLRLMLGDRALHVNVQRGLPPVQLDLLRIEELLANLIENALRYTPSGSPIELKVWQDDGGLRLAVIDHGPGVPEPQREKIFQIFHQGRQHSDRGPGTGLGLAICRGVAAAHGGTLHVEETPGGGASFILTLPAVLQQQAVEV